MDLALLIGSLIVVILILFIYIVIIRQIFKISKFSNGQDAVIRLLSEIALKNGVEVEKVEAIIQSTKWKNR